MSHSTTSDFKENISDIKWNDQGLVAVIAQDHQTHTVLMMAWMNAEALHLTMTQGHAVYWSRSRQKLWHKGESSGHQQIVHDIRLDCDGDAILLLVEQVGGIACHTGRQSCFYRSWDKNNWKENDPVLKPPEAIYNKPV